MLDVHPPHHPARSWADFLTHIATIVIGLLIAVGLEQTVEYFHHRHQLRDFEEQMHDVLEKDRQFIAMDIETLKGYRAWLVDTQVAVITRRQGKPSPQPARNDERTRLRLTTPNLAPYEAARQNGVVLLLDSRRLRLFNRLDYQHDLLSEALKQFLDSIKAMSALRMRYDMGIDEHFVGGLLLAPDLARLSSAEVAEYQAIVGRSLIQLDQLSGRLRVFNALCEGVLGGITEEDALISQTRSKLENADRRELQPDSPAGTK